MAEVEAAVAIVEAREPQESVLLIRRAERVGDSWSGHWSFPGGRCEPRDRDPLCTALRELEEECGIRLAREQMESALPHMLARRKTRPFLTVAPFVLRVPEQLRTVLDSREAAHAEWLPLGLLRDPLAHHLSAVPGRPAEMLFPIVDLSGAPLWGFTYRLITAWLDLDPKCRPIERAGAEAANSVLDFLLSLGLSLRYGWAGEIATVNGVIPVDRVIEHFSAAPCLPGVNCLEVHSDRIRVLGLAWEEYWIRATPPPNG